MKKAEPDGPAWIDSGGFHPYGVTDVRTCWARSMTF